MSEPRKPGDPLPLYVKETTIIGCSICHRVFRCHGDGTEDDLGEVSRWNSTKEPVSGWTRCFDCRGWIR